MLEGAGGQRAVEAAKFEVEVESANGAERPDDLGEHQLFLNLHNTALRWNCNDIFLFLVQNNLRSNLNMFAQVLK